MVYWDSCIFLAYLQNESGRVEFIDQLWQNIAQNQTTKIITSSLSLVEVAYIYQEKVQKTLNPQVEAIIDDMWRDPSLLIVEFSLPIATLARNLMRQAIAQGWTIRTYDAIHLATAQWVHRHVHPITLIYTYDKKLTKYAQMINIAISEPHKTL